MFSCEIYEIYENIFSYRTSLVAVARARNFCQCAPTLYYPEHLKILGKNPPENKFFTEQLPVAAFKCQLFF